MEVKKSKIVKILEDKETNGKYWIVYYSTVIMENGDEHQIKQWKKAKWGYKEWQELEYTIENIKWYDKIVVKEDPKEQYQGKQWFSKDYKKDSITMVLSFAKDLVVAWKLDIKDLEKWADKLYARVLSKLD